MLRASLKYRVRACGGPHPRRFSRPIWGSSSPPSCSVSWSACSVTSSSSRTLILTGILVIGLTSAYFSFVLQPSGERREHQRCATARRLWRAAARRSAERRQGGRAVRVVAGRRPAVAANPRFWRECAGACVGPPDPASEPRDPAPANHSLSARAALRCRDTPRPGRRRARLRGIVSCSPGRRATVATGLRRGLGEWLGGSRHLAAGAWARRREAAESPPYPRLRFVGACSVSAGGRSASSRTGRLGGGSYTAPGVAVWSSHAGGSSQPTRLRRGGRSEASCLRWAISRHRPWRSHLAPGGTIRRRPAPPFRPEPRGRRRVLRRQAAARARGRRRIREPA